MFYSFMSGVILGSLVGLMFALLNFWAALHLTSFSLHKQAKKKCAKEYSKEVKKRYQEKFTEILKSILSSSLICLWLKNSFFFLPGEKRNYSCTNERKTVWKNVKRNHTLFKCAWSINTEQLRISKYPYMSTNLS